MSLLSAVAHFQWDTTAAGGGAGYNVTLGFQPKFFIVYSWGNTTAPPTDAIAGTSSIASFGCGTSSTNRWAIGYSATDGQANVDVTINHRTDGIALRFSNTSRLDVDVEANWPADGIRFLIDVASTDTRTYTVIGFGGTEITNQKVGTFQEPATDITDPGFQPTGMLFASVGFATVPPSTSNTQGMFSIGMTDGTNAWVSMIGCEDAAATMTTASYAKSGEVIALAPQGTGVVLDARATVSGFDSLGVNLAWTESASTRYIFYLAWAGGQFTVGNTTTRTDTTPFNGPSMGFSPVSALFVSACRAEDTADTPTAHEMCSIGVATSASSRETQARWFENGTAGSETANAVDYDSVYINISSADAVQGAMDINSWGDPLSLVMDDADPVASFIGVAAWGAVASALGPQRLGLLGVS
jgi:hypothetical protein